MSNLPQSYPTYRQNLRILKQLWTSGTNEQVINQTIWSFVNKLPVQYQKSILQYCFSYDFPNSSNAFSNASYMFKNIDCAEALQKKISEFSHFYNNEAAQVNEQQLGVVMYNLAWMLQKIEMNSKAQRIIKQNKHLTNLNKKLAVKIWLKNEKLIRKKQKIQSEQIRRFIKIKYTQENLQYILSLSACTIREVYNMALSLKLNKKYRKAALLMERVGVIVKKQDSLHALSKINISQCYFNLGETLKAIKIISELIESNNFYIIPYIKELNTKIFLWSKSNQVLELAKKYSYQHLASKLIINNSQEKVQKLKQSAMNRFSVDNNRTNAQSKILLKNRKLLFLEQKFVELDQLKVEQTPKQKVLNEISHKNSSLRFYKCSTKMKLFGLKLFKELKKQIIKLFDENKCQMNKKKNKRKVSRFEQLKSYVLISDIHSEKNSQVNKTPFTQSNVTSKRGHQNQIDHHWTVIKNSKDQAQIAEKYLSLGDLYTEQQDFQNALQSYKKALEKGRYEAYGRIGNLFYNKGKSSASEYFQKYLKLVDESNHEIRLKLLHCYSKIPWKYKKASEQLEQIITQNPYDTQAHILHATVLMKLKNYQKAIQQCQKLKQINYMCYQNHHILGLLYRIINKNREAFDSFINALRINPLAVPSLIQITYLTQPSNFLPQLIAIYRKALNMNKKNHEIIQILIFLVEKKNLQLEQIKPKLNFSELITVGDSFLANQMLQEAQISYKEAGEYTNNVLLKQKLGNLQYLKKNYDCAQRYYKESQKRKPNFQIQVKLGYTLMKQNKFKQALAKFQEWITNESQERRIILNLLGQCEFKLGNYEKALQRFSELKNWGQDIQNWQILCHNKIQQEKNRKRVRQ